MYTHIFDFNDCKAYTCDSLSSLMFCDLHGKPFEILCCILMLLFHDI